MAMEKPATALAENALGHEQSMTPHFLSGGVDLWEVVSTYELTLEKITKAVRSPEVQKFLRSDGETNLSLKRRIEVSLKSIQS